MKFLASIDGDQSKGYLKSDAPKDEHMMGTTIMAVSYKDGVIMGADSRTSTGYYS